MKFNSLISIARSLWINFRATSRMHTIKEVPVSKSLNVSYLKIKDFSLAWKEHLKVFHTSISLSQFSLFFLFRRKLSFVLKNRQGEHIAYMFLYFNESEWKENCIHIGALFLVEKFQGTGRAAMLEKFVLSYLSQNTTLSEVRARVTVENENAYTLVLGNGFKVLSEYMDATIDKKRVYVTKSLRDDK